jgi:hypothetical protein
MNDLEKLDAIELLIEHDKNTINCHAYKGAKDWQELQENTGCEILRRLNVYNSLVKFIHKEQRRMLSDSEQRREAK